MPYYHITDRHHRAQAPPIFKISPTRPLSWRFKLFYLKTFTSRICFLCQDGLDDILGVFASKLSSAMWTV